MKIALSLSLTFLGATSTWAAKASLSSVQRSTNLDIVPDKFIVEFTKESHSPPTGKRGSGTPHERLYRSLIERKVSFEVLKEFDVPDVFSGVAVSLNNTQSVADVLELPGVQAIRPMRRYPRPKPVFSKTGISSADQGLPDSESTHIGTGVAKLHDLGITGKGVKIGIIDTGIDYTHPSLGGGFGPGFKVAGGFDLVGDAYTGANAPVPDPDPLDQCAGHGTHVAGIVGANPGNEFNISGVAYDATIFAYRVFGCDPLGMVTDDVIVDALLTGVKDGMNILTMSLGGSDGWTEGTATVVASRIATSGKVVTVAAGNDGLSGPWFASSPGAAINAIAVASTDNTILTLQTLTVEGVVHDPIVYNAIFPLSVGETKMPLYATSTDPNVPDDACNPLPASTPDLSGFVVLVRRGTCPFVTKLANIAAFGGNISLIYNNVDGLSIIDVNPFKGVLIRAEDGVFLAEQLAAGAHINVSFPQSVGPISEPDPNGGLVSTFTTYGPTYDMFFKPSVAAPGGNIISTFPVTMGSFALLSGTSMATPFMAGSAALLLSVEGKTEAVAKSALTRFQSTAMPVSSSTTDGDPLQTASQQGAGLVQVFDAIFGTTRLSKAELKLNDTAHFAGPQKFTVTNHGKIPQTYTLSHIPAGTAPTVDPNTTFVVDGPVSLLHDFATVTFNTRKFTLSPGQSHDVVATITPPKVDAATFPVYSGFIYVTSRNESVHATYLGVAASLKDKAVIDNTDLFFNVTLPLVLDSAGNVQEGPTNYTFVGEDAPTILWRQVFGSPRVRLDLVPSSTNFDPTLHSRDTHIGSLISFMSHTGGTFGKVPITGSILEMDFVVRNDDATFTDNTLVLKNAFGNGTVIPNGSYKVLLRALKVTGDPANEADYESWLSPTINVIA